MFFLDRTSDGQIAFEATGRQEPPSGEQIREFEEMILTKLPSPTPSEGSGSITGASTPDSSGFFSSLLINPILRFKSAEFSSQENLQGTFSLLVSISPVLVYLF